jgi:hypothetical protein
MAFSSVVTISILPGYSGVVEDLGFVGCEIVWLG